MTPLPHSEQDVSSARKLFENLEDRSFDDSMLDLEQLDDIGILMSEEKSVDKETDPDLTQLHDMLPTILKEFQAAGLEKYYIKFNNLVHSGQFDFSNIAFLLFCDVVQFLSLESTTQMRYDIPATRKFWYLSHLLFQGRLQRFMSGYKNMGSVKSGKEEPGYYAPSETRINFAVPNDMTMLMPSEIQVPEVNGPGKFSEMISALSNKDCTYILTFDGKKLAPGLTKDSGDVDLLGHETGPTLQARQEEIVTKLADVSELRDIMMKSQREMDESINCMLASDKTEMTRLLKNVHKTLSLTVKDLRQFISKKMHMLDSFKIRNEKGDGKKYDYVIDSIKTLLYRSQSVVKNAMVAIDDICKSIALLQGSSTSFATSSSVSLEKLNNFVSLNEPETVASALELQDTKDVPPPLVKQRTPEWHVIRKQACVTGSSAYYCLGLESLKRQKEAISKLLTDHVENDDKHEKERSEALEHGIKNEINALATLSSKVLPVYYPDLTYFEEGCYLFKEEGDTIIEVSPDGSVRPITDIDCEDEDEMIRSSARTKFAVEVKCPHPSYKYAVPVYYSLPEKYVCQIMSEMKLLECQEALLVSWSPESTTVFCLKFSDTFFEAMSKEIKTVFLNGTPKQPKRKSEGAKMLKSMSKEISEATMFIGEFKSVTSVHSESTHLRSGVYTSNLDAKNPSNTKAAMSVNGMLSSLKMVEDIINESYQIQRQKASEVMPILLSSVNREWNPETGHATPIGYFLRGYSLSTDVMRHIADDFQEECHKNGIYVPIQTFDGQWLRLVVRDENDNPQTELEFAKDHWTRVKKLSKTELVAQLKMINKNPDVQKITTHENATETQGVALLVTSKKS